MSVHSLYRENIIFIRKTFAVFAELESEAADLHETTIAMGDWELDWRWLGEPAREPESFACDCALIH